jgi:hypothetical protein
MQLNAPFRLIASPDVAPPSPDVIAQPIVTFETLIQPQEVVWVPTDPNNPSTVLELKLRQDFPGYNLNTLRKLFLQYLTSDRDPIKSYRVAVQMAYDTELACVMRGFAPPVALVLSVVVDTRRRYLDVDNDLKTTRFLFGAAVQEAVAAKLLTPPYATLIQGRMQSVFVKTRVNAVATLLVIVAAQQVFNV